MALIPYERPGRPTCYYDTSCAVGTQEEIRRILEAVVKIALKDHIRQYRKNRSGGGSIPQTDKSR